MSRIGKKPVFIPKEVTLNFEPGYFEVKGPKGTLKQSFPSVVTIEFDAEKRLASVVRHDDEKQSSAYQGLTRALLQNAVKGVVEQFEKALSIIGTGYNARLKGKHLELQIGYCLPQSLMIPDGIIVEVPAPTKIVIRGCDRQLVGQFTANVRAIRLPDSYKGKGVRYVNEVIKLKATKSVGGKK